MPANHCGEQAITKNGGTDEPCINSCPKSNEAREGNVRRKEAGQQWQFSRWWGRDLVYRHTHRNTHRSRLAADELNLLHHTAALPLLSAR